MRKSFSSICDLFIDLKFVYLLPFTVEQLFVHLAKEKDLEPFCSELRWALYLFILRVFVQNAVLLSYKVTKYTHGYDFN